jgi:uncharacterized repeat protein (TIGR03803 family)
MRKLNLWGAICLVCVIGALAVSGSAAQTFTTLLSFDGISGVAPQGGSLVQGLNGNYYGTTYFGGGYAYGTVFEITAAGKLTTLYGFCAKTSCDDGSYPTAGLVLATNGNLYGTTYLGGTHECGSVFEITASGRLTTLLSFDSRDGAFPFAGLVQATNGNFYGTTEEGGAHNDGTIFEITPAGKLTKLHSFDFTDGELPLAGLVQATNGDLYGTTSGGGSGNGGTVFQITTSGKLTTLYNFCSKPNCTDGAQPIAGLAQASNGNFYGTTASGGLYNDGTVFEITAGKLTTLLSFDGTDGADPNGTMVQATNGNLYGTTAERGSDNHGTIFDITPAGKLTTLINFEGTNGQEPLAGPSQATNGNFYGTTVDGGAHLDGTVYGLSEGLGPFLETLPTSGNLGAPVIILGNSLTGATSVTFNGAAATFEVVSSTEITTTVPKGATTGPVKVKTSSGTLTSNVSFQVT